MRFDQWMDFADDDVDGAGNSHRQRVPAGTHTGDIVGVEIANKKFKASDRNPEGTSLVVRWSKPGFYEVESTVPVQYQGLIGAICRAAGVSAPQRGEDWDEKQLIGRVVTVTIEDVVAKGGTEYQRVTKWHASPQKPVAPAAEPKKKAPARTPAAKAHAEFKERSGEDDIPF